MHLLSVVTQIVLNSYAKSFVKIGLKRISGLSYHNVIRHGTICVNRGLIT